MGDGGDEGRSPLPLSDNPDDLGGRLDRVLATEGPETAEDRDLADAACSLLLPDWPAYQGAIDLEALRRALAPRILREARAEPADPDLPPPARAGP
jgi:hypothetical protein